MQDLVKTCEEISNLAIRSMLYEAFVSPKPGLVDRFNNGAHNDMNYFLFMDSISCLGFPFYEMAKIGFQFDNINLNELFIRMRKIGLEAENKMFKITSRVNTHKGLIFSLGLVSTASAYLINKKELSIKNICETISKMTEGIVKRELKHIIYSKKINIYETKLTYGEKNFLKYGITGIRGEAEKGFASVINVGLPTLKKFKDRLKENKNAVFLQALLNLMATVNDSNIIGRHGMSALEYVQDSAKKALVLGGAFTKKGLKFIHNLDTKFIVKNISPGGSADLLNVTIMLYLIEESFCVKRENNFSTRYVSCPRKKSIKTKKITASI